MAEYEKHKMIAARKRILGQITVTVELFGMARIACDKRLIELTTDAPGSVSGLVEALLRQCPQLAGIAVREDGTGLLESYTLNVNGSRFVSGDHLDLEHGDSVLLFSSQAGG